MEAPGKSGYGHFITLGGASGLAKHVLTPGVMW